MEEKALKIFTGFSALEGLLTLWIVLATSSSNQKVWLYHYSFAWVLMILVVLILLMALTGVFIQLCNCPNRIVPLFQKQFQEDDQIILHFLFFLFLFFSGIALLILPNLFHWSVFQRLGAYLNKARPLLVWLTCLAAQVSITIGIVYSQTISRPANWRWAWDDIKKYLWAHIPGVAGVGLMGCLSLFMMLPLSPAFAGKVPAHDSGIFLYFGQRILAGDVPFRDLWDHKPPLIFFIDALGLWLGRRSMWGVWAVEFISLAIAGYFAFRILGEKISTHIRFFTVACMLLNLPLVLEGGNLTEEYALPFQFASLFLYLRLRTSIKPALFSFLIGAAFANTILLKQTMVGVWLTMLVMGLAEVFFFNQNIRWRWLGAAALGFGLVLGIWISYFTCHHALWEFWDVAFRYNFIYSDITLTQRFTALKGILRFLFQSVNLFFAALLVWLGTAIYVIHNQKRIDRTLTFCLINIPIEIFLISISGKDYRHYFMSLIPGFTIFIGYCGNYIFNRLKVFQKGQLQLLFCDLLFVLLSLQGGSMIVNTYRQKPEIPISQAVQYVEKNTHPDEPLLIWGSQSAINFLSERKSPTRFVHQKPLFQKGYTSQALLDEFLSGLKASPPKMIIDTEHPSTPFVEVDAAGNCSPPMSRYPQGMSEIYAYICSHYHLVEYLGKDHWLVLQHNTEN